MPDYTMRLTWPDTENDYVFRVNGQDVGRCYRHALKRLEWRWHWTLYGSSAHGDEPTREQAQARFKKRLNGWQTLEACPQHASTDYQRRQDQHHNHDVVITHAAPHEK